jgi:acyl dehydratase
MVWPGRPSTIEICIIPLEIGLMTTRYLEDFAAGQMYGSGWLRVEQERMKTFAEEFDPQPFHLDEEAARDTIFRGLAASGWHTAALTMRLLVESELKPVGGIIGIGFDEFRWPHPVRPGDELRTSRNGKVVTKVVRENHMNAVKIKKNTIVSSWKPDLPGNAWFPTRAKAGFPDHPDLPRSSGD